MPERVFISYQIESNASGRHAVCGFVSREAQPNPPMDRFVYVDERLTLYSESGPERFDTLSAKVCPDMMQLAPVPPPVP